MTLQNAIAPNKPPLLSIVIPTKNRVDYVRYSISNCLDIDSGFLEVVLYDNSDDESTSEWVENNVADYRLRYFRDNEQLSMTENYERALSQATGEYIAIIGDDDGVTPEIITVTEWMKVNNCDCLFTSNPAHFVWPDLKINSLGPLSPGALSIREYSGVFRYVNPSSEMLKCTIDAGQEFHDLPRGYYGIANRSVYMKIKSSTGFYFNGLSPDMAAALALAQFSSRVLYLDYPVFLPGSSAKSNAGLSGLNKHRGLLSEQQHIPRKSIETWSDLIPKFYSVQTVWGAAALETMVALKRNDLIEKFNYGKLYAFCYIFHRDLYERENCSIANAVRCQGKPAFFSIFVMSKWFIYWWLKRVSGFVARKISPKNKAIMPEVKSANNIKLAVDELMSLVSQRISLLTILSSAGKKQ